MVERRNTVWVRFRRDFDFELDEDDDALTARVERGNSRPASWMLRRYPGFARLFVRLGQNTAIVDFHTGREGAGVIAPDPARVKVQAKRRARVLKFWRAACAEKRREARELRARVFDLEAELQLYRQAQEEVADLARRWRQQGEALQAERRRPAGPGLLRGPCPFGVPGPVGGRLCGANSGGEVAFCRAGDGCAVCGEHEVRVTMQQRGYTAYQKGVGTLRVLRDPLCRHDWREVSAGSRFGVGGVLLLGDGGGILCNCVSKCFGGAP